MNPVNLKGLFGRKYRVTVDRESDESRLQDPWMFQIRCQRGLIYPWSSTHLAVQCDGHRYVAATLATFGECVQDGDTEKTFTFPVEDFDAVAKLVRPYRRRVLSPEQRERQVAVLAKARSVWSEANRPLNASGPSHPSFSSPSLARHAAARLFRNRRHPGRPFTSALLPHNSSRYCGISGKQSYHSH